MCVHSDFASLRKDVDLKLENAEQECGLENSFSFLSSPNAMRENRSSGNSQSKIAVALRMRPISIRDRSDQMHAILSSAASDAAGLTIS